MKVYKYWVLEKAKITINREEMEVKCYGGSNISFEDAHIKAKEKIDKVKSKIAGNPQVFESYEVEIREEIIQQIDEKDIITRNRYGAQVLNTQELMILDIDKPKFSVLGFFKKQEIKKIRMIEMVRKLSQKSVYQGLGFRIYETNKGIRVIVLGKSFDPKSIFVWEMMREFNCDSLYRLLCKKQDCFRARLTPKPSRMRVHGYKVIFPRDEAEEKNFQKWLAEYDRVSWKYSACKFIEQIGMNGLPEAVRVHDEITGANRNKPLA